MPVVLPAITGLLTANMTAAGMLGTDVSKIATGIATGLTQWIPQIIVQTIDTGTLGAGKGTPTPLLVPQPALYAALLAGDAAFGFIGILNPAFTLGVANGLSQAFLAMLTNTAHPSVGVGAGVARFIAPPAGPAMTAGFTAVGLKGMDMPKKANAIGQGLDTVFASLVLPVTIAGSASPSPSSGTGVGNII